MQKSKRYRQQMEAFDRDLLYQVNEAIDILKEMPHAKFDESVEVAFRLGIDPRQSDQNVRGAVPLPHGTGKSVRVIVVAEGPTAEAATAAGADEVGFEELLNRIKEGWLDFDVMIATPSAMQKVRTLGKVLGPRGLMPNPKTGTVTDNPADAVKEAKAGRVEFRADRTGCAHVQIGKISFDNDALLENFMTIANAIVRARPATAKGAYMQSCTVSTTMSPGVRVDTRELVRE